VDSHARTSALPELEKVWTESEAVFSSKSSDSSENATPDLFSSKTSLPSEPVEGKQWLKNWPRWGMTVDGLLFQPPQLEPITSAKDGFYWPTPTVCGNYQNKGNMIGLATAVKMWPTPCARDWKDTGKSPSEMRRNSVTLATIAGGQLNPECVEWLMGYRIGHTELDALVIQWFRSKSEKRSKS